MPHHRDERMAKAAAALRINPRDPSDFRLADLLDRLADLAPYWHEPYAAPFVPVIEAGARIADEVLR